MDMATPAGRLSADILAGVAKHEIEQKSDRQRRAVEQAVEQGRRVGGRRPFGYTRQDDPAETGGRRRPVGIPASCWPALRWAASPETGTPADFTPRRDAATAPLDVDAAGRVPHAAEAHLCRAAVTPGPDAGPAKWPALVDEGMWRAAQAVLTDPSRRTPGGPRALLTGVALCGVCGLTVHSGGANTGRSYRVYRCRSMTHVNRRAEPVEEYVEAVVVERLSRPDAVDLLTVNDRPDTAGLHAEADQLRRRLDALADDLGIDERTWPVGTGHCGPSWSRSRAGWLMRRGLMFSGRWWPLPMSARCGTPSTSTGSVP